MIVFHKTISACLISGLLLSACDLAPDYFRPTTAAIPPSFKEAPDWRVATPSDAIERGEWWALFGDPVLSELERQVLVSNQNLAAAKAAYDQSRALLREQRAAFLPTVSISAGTTKTGPVGTPAPKSSSSGSTSSGTSGRSSSPGTTVSYSSTLGATWEPDLWGRIGNSVSQAGALAEASKADLANATLSAQGELALNYTLLRGLEVQKAILADTIEAYERALTITQNRYNSGISQRSDVLQAETALRNARASDADLVRQRAILEHAIAVLVGENPSTFAMPAAKPNETVPNVPSTLPSALLERRPDIAAAERSVVAANANIGIQRSAYFPTIDITGDISSNAQRYGQLFSAATSVWSLGLSGALTLLDFGARSARVDQARAGYEQTVAQYRQTVLIAFQQTEDQLAAARVLFTVEQERAEAANAANQAEQIARNQYLAGQIGYADLIVVQTTALSARIARAQAIVDRQTAAIALIQAIGGHWADDATDPSSAGSP